MRDLSVRQLKMFLKLTETGSFTETANFQGVSQPALSRAIKEMERNVGTQLFDRSARGVTLTNAGLTLLPIAKHITEEFDTGFSMLAECINASPDHITIASIDTMMWSVVAPAIVTLRDSFPNIEISLISGFSSDIAEAVTSGRAEIGFMLRPGGDARLVYTPVTNDELLLVCRPDRALANSNVVNWEDLKDQNLITLNKSSALRAQIDTALGAVDTHVASIIECAEFSHMGAFLGQGLGVAIVPSGAVTGLGTALTAIPFSPPLTRQLGMVTRGDRPLTEAAAKLIKIAAAA